MFKQGDIVIVKFPFTDGSEFKKRPALVISNDLVNNTRDYLLVQITFKNNKDGLSVSIKNVDYLSNLPLQSYLRTHKIFTINESLIISKLTSVRSSFLEIVVQKIEKLIKPIL